MKTQACKFFLQGRCTRGQLCTYSHEIAWNTWRADAEISVPPFHAQHGPTTSSTLARQHGIPCRFYGLGHCSRGDDCAYEHIYSSNTTSTGAHDEVPTGPPSTAESQMATPASTPKPSPRVIESRNLKGASVDFGPGAAVNSVQIGNSTELSAQVQMSSVTCSWYKPSRSAWLLYSDVRKALEAEGFITDFRLEILGRKITAYLEYPDIITSVHLANLDAVTSKFDIVREIPGHLQPFDIVMGDLSYTTSLGQAGEIIKKMLSGFGFLENLELNDTFSPNQVRATARFATDEAARSAVRELSGVRVIPLGKSKLWVNPLVSVKFNVLRDVYSAIQEELDSAKPRFWAAGHVKLKVFPPSSFSQNLIAVRLYGENARSVAQAKDSLEKILAGDVAMDDGEIIWDDFFATSAGLNYLDDLAWKCNVKVHRDSRRKLLTLYGSSRRKNEILLALAARNTRLIATTYYIRLNTEEDINKARDGGFRRIVAAFGKEHASMDLRSRIKVITIVGSFQDSEMARKLLDCNTDPAVRQLSLEGSINNPDCIVCYTEADQVYRTPCGHIYCASCLAHQCASAADQNIPLRCLGASGECAQVFSLRELKNTLRSEAFERLLEDSFAMHIRTHPKEYQYCPTPDCEQIYSTSIVEFESVFTCPKCLTPICTSCQVVHHDGKSTLYLPHGSFPLPFYK